MLNAVVTVSATQLLGRITTVDGALTAHLSTTPEVVLAQISETGTQGYSAYEIAVINGFVGTEAEWLYSLRGGVSGVEISAKDLNRITRENDGLYVSDDLTPDPLAYYILAKN